MKDQKNGLQKEAVGKLIDMTVWTAIFFGLVNSFGYVHLSGVIRVTPF